MSTANLNADLPQHVLRSLGELLVATTELDELLAGTLLAGSDVEAVNAWRISALQASEDSARVAHAATEGHYSGEALTVPARDGSLSSLSADSISRLATRIARLSRAGRAIGVEPSDGDSAAG